MRAKPTAGAEDEDGIEMTDEELASKAAELGLQELAKSQPGELKKALENAEALASRIPQDIHWTEEPSHIFGVAPHRKHRS
jgi:hypothetical protein